MIVVYDAHCLLCSGFTQFLLKHDRQGVLRFASMQGTTGRQLLAQAGVDPDDVDTVLFVRNGHAWCESAAVLRILHVLGCATHSTAASRATVTSGSDVRMLASCRHPAQHSAFSTEAGAGQACRQNSSINMATCSG
jgi:predicted DCC family thiol-disulfide oxidoreductase YuxK